MKLKEIDLETIIAMADCDMRINRVSKKLLLSNNSVVYRLDSIERKTGLNPRCFYDLVKLLEVAKENDN